MGYFSPINIAIFLIDVAMAVHVIRSGRSPLWIMGMGLASYLGTPYIKPSAPKLPDIDFYIAFARWRAACIHAGVWTRYQAGDMGEAADADEVTGPSAIDEQARAALAQLRG